MRSPSQTCHNSQFVNMPNLIPLRSYPASGPLQRRTPATTHASIARKQIASLSLPTSPAMLWHLPFQPLFSPPSPVTHEQKRNASDPFSQRVQRNAKAHSPPFGLVRAPPSSTGRHTAPARHPRPSRLRPRQRRRGLRARLPASGRPFRSGSLPSWRLAVGCAEACEAAGRSRGP